MKQRDRVTMTADEANALLAGSRKLQLATINPDGTPHLVTMFYVMQDGQIAFWTYRASQKARNLARDPRVTCLVEDGTDYFELRGVSINGTAELVRDHDRIHAIGAAVATRMVGASSFEELGDIGRDMVDKQATKRIAVIIHPEHVATWDHRKMV